MHSALALAEIGVYALWTEADYFPGQAEKTGLKRCLQFGTHPLPPQKGAAHPTAAAATSAVLITPHTVGPAEGSLKF